METVNVQLRTRMEDQKASMATSEVLSPLKVAGSIWLRLASGPDWKACSHTISEALHSTGPLTLKQEAGRKGVGEGIWEDVCEAERFIMVF